MTEIAASPAPYLWLAAFLLAALPLLSLATLLLERSGPIRLRHWVEETGGRLRRLWEDPARFGLYRYLLNVTAKLLPLALCLALGTAGTRLGAPDPYLYAVAIVALVVALSEIAGRRMLRSSPEVALASMTWVYRGAFYVFSPGVGLRGPLLGAPRDLVDERDEDDEASE